MVEPVPQGLALGATYGEQQEHAATALNQLLVIDHVPDEPHHVEQLLACRGAIIDALQQRLSHLGGYQTHSPDVEPMRPEAGLALAAIPIYPAELLERVAQQLPRLPRSDTPVSPIDALGPSDDPTVEHWRSAAVSLLASAHALESATEKPWLIDAGAAWYVIGDTAVALEAVVVLDQPLEEVGLLADHRRLGQAHQRVVGGVRRQRAPWTLAEQRMTTSQITRASGWYATTSAADLAEPAIGRPQDGGPVRVVTQPGDLIAAERQVGDHLRIFTDRNSFSSSEQRMDAATARVVTAGQLDLCTALQAHCAAQPKLAKLAEEFGHHRDMLRDIEGGVSKLIDVEPRGTNQRALWQQREVTVALRRFHGAPPLNPRQLQELATSTHHTLTNFARALRHECHRDASNLRTKRYLGTTGNDARVHHKHPLSLALAAIIKSPPPLPTAVTAALSNQRNALRTTLDNTPTGRRPSPYPQGRGKSPGRNR